MATITALPDDLFAGVTAIQGSIVAAIVSAGTMSLSYVLTCQVTTAAGLIAVANRLGARLRTH